MQRPIIFLLIVFSVALVAEIVAVTVLRDYQRHGDIALGRALSYAAQDAREVAGLRNRADEEVRGQQHPGESEAFAEYLPALKAEMLYLINSERVRAQVPPLTFGANPAAQHHAENMMAYGYRSHWDIYGMTPQIRYTLAGGTNRVMQNIAGPVEILYPNGGTLEAWGELVGSIHRELMSDPEELANILDPLHRRLNFGISCNGSHCWVVQQFESDHVNFSELPAISGSRFDVAGEFGEGFELDGVVIWHHPYPRRLSLGQLDATYRYGYGQIPVSFLRPPLSPDRYYPDRLVGYEWDGGIDPYTLDPALLRTSASPLMVEVAHSAAVPWTTANRWEQSGAAFSIEADLAPVLEASGAGVYTVQIWGRRGEERVPLTNYAIFLN